ncbi:MAG: AarF/ABC1/UbiB kinase family protein [Planctomycetota bacterium]|nr:MAG: AarF/ABC1/UbiB kinase family protein [Planctomycetota bacterium]
MKLEALRFFRHFGRMRQIATVLINYGFADLVDRLGLGQYLQWGRRLLFRRREPLPPVTRAARVRMVFEELGATFIKFGQVLSTRPDLLPEDVIAELAKLQEHVAPFSAELARREIEQQLGAPIDQLFSEFGEEPVASASLAQVHKARLRDGTPVAVKVRRPAVVREIESDLVILFHLATLLERHVEEAEVFDPVGLVGYFARTIRRELNFNREARTIDEFRRLFRNDATLHVPAVHWDYTTEAVLTLEWVEGCRVDDLERLDRWGIDRRQLAARGARLYMRQAFEIGLFHGDPHPGNIRILRDGRICLLDYGMVGVLDEQVRDDLVDLLVAVSRQDAAEMVERVLRLGNPVGPVDRVLLKMDARDFVNTYYGFELRRIDMRALLNDFIGILRSHRIRLPGDLMLLIRALITLEGIGRRLDPGFNLVEHVTPFIEDVLRERYNWENVRKRVVREAGTLLAALRDIPVQSAGILHKLGRDDFRIQLEHRRLDRFIDELDRSSNRIVVGMIISALIVASALLIRSFQIDSSWLMLGSFGLSSVLGVWLVISILRRGGL